MRDIVIDAVRLLINYDSDLIENATKEEAINHQLANHLERLLIDRGVSFGHVDIEYDKYLEDEKKISNGKSIRPDIIVHQRRSGKNNNLIVIEAKKNYSNDWDERKIIDLVDSPHYAYSFGALISYLPTRNYIKLKFYSGSDNWEIGWMDKTNLTYQVGDRYKRSTN